MSTGLDLVKSILRKVTAYQSGEQIAQTDAQDCLDVVNAMLDSWSTDKQYVYGSQEYILEWTVNQILYKVGNPISTDLGLAPFTGTVTGGSNVITNVTNISSGLVAGTNTLGLVFGPAFAILKTPGESCFRSLWNSSANLYPGPPDPVPVGSPPCAMKLAMTL